MPLNNFASEVEVTYSITFGAVGVFISIVIGVTVAVGSGTVGWL